MDLDFTGTSTLRDILASLHQGIAVYGADRRLLYINDQMRSLTGGTQEVGAPLRDVASRHGMFTEDGRQLSEKEFPIEKAFAGTETINETFLYIEKKGTRHWLLVNCVRILNENGELEYVVTNIHDITNRRHREDKLRFMVESAKILSLSADFKERLVEKAKLAVPSLADWAAIDILNSSQTGTERVALIHSDPGQLTYLSEYEKKYPPNPNDPGSPYQVIIRNAPRFYPLITDDMYESLPDQEQREAVRKLHLKSIMVIPIVSRGRGLGAMTLAYAESGRTYMQDDFQFFQEYCAHVGVVLENARLYEEIVQRDKSKDLFLASLSHELRNPLAPIKSSLELLKFHDLLSEVREEVEVIEHQFDHMAKLLGDLLDVSRFTQGKIALTKRSVELRKLVERALKSTDSLLRTADITLHFTYPSAQLFAEIDETRLEQVIVNLMSNAAKFTPAGGSIWVDVERAGDRAVIKIRDNGAGIPPEDLPNIFDLYYQGRRENITNAGLGIGLLLVDQIVRLHEGTVTAESEGLGKGSSFTITLPLAKSAETSAHEKKSAENALHKKVLVVDDNMQAADSLVKLLNKLGARADALYSAEEALEREDLDSYDILLLDVGMPRVDGYQLVRALRERGLQKPIVALTGYGMAEDKKKALDAGFSAHLTKPVGLQEIMDTFQSLS